MREQARQAVTVAALCVLSVAGYQAVAAGGDGPAQARASATASRSGLHVTGSGTVTVKPDRATISFTADGRGATLAAAQDQASADMARVMAAMRAGGISRSDLQTTEVSGNRARKGGFVAHQSLTVTVRDASRAGALVSAGVAAGADSSYGPDFEVTDTHAAYDQALAAAVKQARARADAIAAAAGVRITGIVSIDENGGYQPQMYAADALGATKQASPMPVPTQQGTREVSASVAVVFSTG